MAVPTDNAYSGPYAANGVTTVFPFTFKAPAADEVAVQIRDAIGTDVNPGPYSVTINSASGGEVTLDKAPADGLTVVVYLDTDFTQGLQFEDGSAWLAEPVNEGYDRAALRAQVLRRDVGRGLLTPLGESGFVIPQASQRAGKGLFFDENGDLDPITPDDFAEPAQAAATSAQGSAVTADAAAREAAGYAASAFMADKLYATIAEGIAAGPVGEGFITDDPAVALRDDDGNLTGATNTEEVARACMRVEAAPGYVHRPGSDPGNRKEQITLKNRTAFPTKATAAALVIDPDDTVNRIDTGDRGVYEKRATAPSADEATYGTAFTDAGGKVWAKPRCRIMSARNDAGLIAHTDLSTYGALQGTIVDQAGKLQHALDLLAAHGGGEMVFDEGMIGAIPLKSSTRIPLGVGMRALFHQGNTSSLKGLKFCSTDDGVYNTAAGGTVTLANDGTCNDGFLFFDNINPASPSTWIDPYANALKASIEALMVDGRVSLGVGGIYTGAPKNYLGLRGWDVSTLIGKPSGLYMDQLQIIGMNVAQRSSTTHFLIDISGLGEGLLIANVHANYTSTGDICKNIYVGTSRGGRIEGCISNGITLIEGADAFTVANQHGEGHQIQIASANVTVEDCHLHGGEGLPGSILITNPNKTRRNNMRVDLNSNTFVHFDGETGGGCTGWSPTEQLDVDIRDYDIAVRHNGGNRREVSFSGQVGQRFHVMPLFGDSTNGGQFDAFKHYGHVIGHKPGTIWKTETGATIEVSGTSRSALDGWGGVAAVTDFVPTSSTVTFRAPTDTYYYQPVLVQDYPRKIARLAATTPEVSRSATFGAQALPDITISQSEATRGPRTFMCFRGTTSNLYDKYCFVTSMGCARWFDNGEAFNSIAWEDIPGGPVSLETFNNNGMACRIEYVDGVARLIDPTVTTEPTVGTWVVGDEMMTPAATVDGNNMRLKSRTKLAAGWVAERVSTVSPAT